MIVVLLLSPRPPLLRCERVRRRAWLAGCWLLLAGCLLCCSLSTPGSAERRKRGGMEWMDAIREGGAGRGSAK